MRLVIQQQGIVRKVGAADVPVKVLRLQMAMRRNLTGAMIDGRFRDVAISATLGGSRNSD